MNMDEQPAPTDTATPGMTAETPSEEAQEARAVDQGHIDQLTQLAFAMTAAQLHLQRMHPTERRRFLKDPQRLLSIVFGQLARQLGTTDEGTQALVDEMRRRGF